VFYNFKDHQVQQMKTEMFHRKSTVMFIGSQRKLQRLARTKNVQLLYCIWATN